MTTEPIKADTRTRELMADPFVGTMINGKFEVLSRLADGGMGRIYRARQVALDRLVALKVLKPQFTTDTADKDDSFQVRFTREASMLAKLQHGNIVTVYDFGTIEGTDPIAYYMAMEFLAGQTLRERIHDVGRLTLPELFAVVRQVARGLRSAHRQGIIHRDLKPSNIMIVPQDGGGETVKVLDFGLVKVLTDETESVTKEGAFLGSPRYMAPEQISRGNVDARTDVYALGVIMYHALCGRVPFDGQRALQTLMAHLTDPVPPLGADVPPVVEGLVLHCLAKDPADRPASMDELLRGIVDCETALGIAAQPSLIPDQESGSQHRSSGLDRAALTTPAHRNASARLHWGWISAIVGVVVSAAVGVVVWRTSSSHAVAVVESDSSAAAPSAPVEKPEARQSFTLSIDSDPRGAEVYEGEDLLGTTPLHMTISRDSVRDRPRKLTLRMDGRLPYSIVQGLSTEDVVVKATLDPAPPGGTAVVQKQPERPVAPPRTTTVPAPSQKDNEIRMTR